MKEYVKAKRFRRAGFLCLVLVSAMMLGCSQSDPVTLGFVGGLSGRVSDLGGPARNGMLLAIEQQNARGGINGQPIQVLVEDDKQDPAQAERAVRALIKGGADVIIGPVTSAMAVKVAPIASEAKKLMVGVTVTTNALSGKDDYFIRCLSPTSVHAGEVAEFLLQKRGLRNFAAVYDLKNEAYSLGWVNDFKARVESLGGSVQAVENFTSGNQEELIPIAQKLLSKAPEMVIFVTNAVDAALLAKLVRQQDDQVILGTSEWAGTERLIELGGRYIEGAYVPQYLDRSSQEPGYQKFLGEYRQRFNQEPGFPGLIAYNATNVVIDQLSNGAQISTLKESILAKSRFPAIQGDVLFDQYGDAKSKTYVTQVQQSQFVVQAR